MALGSDASTILRWLGERYVEAGYPNHRVWTFSPGEEKLQTFAELRAHGYIKQNSLGRPATAHWVLTDAGLRWLLEREPAPSPGARASAANLSVALPAHQLTIVNSTIGAVAVGDQATAHGVAKQGDIAGSSQQTVPKDAQRAADAVVSSANAFRRRPHGFTEREVLDLHAASLAAGLHENRVALHAGLDRGLSASLPMTVEPAAQLLIDLHSLNDLVKAGDAAPLATWLRAAIALRPAHPQVGVFRGALVALSDYVAE